MRPEEEEHLEQQWSSSSVRGTRCVGRQTREKLRSPGERVCTVHCGSFTMQCMVASSIPCKLSLCADRAHACAGDSHTSSAIDVASPTIQNVLAIASPHELHGDSWPSSSTGTSSFCCNHQYSITAVTTSKTYPSDGSPGGTKNCRPERAAECWAGYPFSMCCHPSTPATPAINPCAEDPRFPFEDKDKWVEDFYR